MSKYLGLVLLTCIFIQIADAALVVDIYDQEKAFNGTTLLADAHDPNNPQIIEVDMEGKVTWVYSIPDSLKAYTNPGLDVEWIEKNDHVLFVLPGKGVYEIDRDHNIVWYHSDSLISHDADRLENGNTLYVYGFNDTKIDPQVTEIDSVGNIVWQWFAKDEFDVEPYSSMTPRGGWTHINAATRLSDGSTMINMRNFSLTTIVNFTGEDTVYRNFDWSEFGDATRPDPHEPEILANGNILVALQNDSPYRAAEIDTVTKELVWTYTRTGLRTTRDCDRLPNGNTLMVGVLSSDEESVVFEVTPENEIVWQMKLTDSPATNSPGWFYKAERIGETGEIRGDVDSNGKVNIFDLLVVLQAMGGSLSESPRADLDSNGTINIFDLLEMLKLL